MISEWKDMPFFAKGLCIAMVINLILTVVTDYRVNEILTFVHALEGVR